MTTTQKSTKKYMQRYTDEEEKLFITEWMEVNFIHRIQMIT